VLDLTPSRRQFLAALGVAALGMACSKKATPPSGPASGSIDNLTSGATQLSLLTGNSDPSDPLPAGTARFAFALTTSTGGVLTGGTPQVYIAKDRTSKALGPFAATWYQFTAYGKTGDTSPKTPLPGTYVADIDVPQAGNWFVAGIAQNGSQSAAGVGAVVVSSGPVVAKVGSKAISVKTPVATTDPKIAQICTRKPVDHLHYISLDAALKNGRPTVVSFATPLLCESKLCGPVVDEEIVAFQKFGPGKANFIHVEEFLPGSDLKPPPPLAENQSPAFKAWGLVTEPWTVVIDKDGVTRARFDGPTTAPEIEAALQPLL
jgi:hypothetical protein